MHLLDYLVSVYGDTIFEYQSEFNMGYKWSLGRAIATQDLCFREDADTLPIFSENDSRGLPLKIATFYASCRRFFKDVS